MKLRMRLILAELPLIAVLALVGAFSVQTIVDLGKTAGRILEANYLSILAIQRIQRSMDTVERALLGPRADRARVEAALSELEGALSFQERNITEQGEAEATRAVRAAIVGWRAAVTATDVELPEERRRDLFLARVRPAADLVARRLEVILELNQEAMTRKSRATNALAARLTQTLALLTTGAVALVLVVAFVLSGKIAGPLSRLAGLARRIGEGDLSVAIPAPEGGDEVSTLEREFSRMAETLRTSRKSTLGELLEATEAAQAAIDSLVDPVLSFDDDGSFRRANREARTLLGVDTDAPDPLGAIHPELREAVALVRDRTLRGQGGTTSRGLGDSVAVLVEGKPRYFLPLASPVYGDGDGAIVGVTVLLRDVTSLRRADELKSDLLATVAHELRTPLTGVRMGLHLCLEKVVGPLTEKQEELLHAAREDADRLHALVEGILSASKIEAGALVGRRKRVTPRELVDTALAPVRVPAADRKIALGAEAVEEPALEVDAESVVIALGNLLANALKHTDEGGRIDVTARPRDGGIRFEVADTGPGIAPEHRAKLFEKFYRVPGSPPGGTGLGLAIVRDIVLAHDGEIGVESDVGKGSRFWIWLPAAAASPVEGGPAAPG